jgi:hypothetical protein
MHCDACFWPAAVETRPPAQGAHSASEPSPGIEFPVRPALHMFGHVSTAAPSTLPHRPSGHGTHCAFAVSAALAPQRPAPHRRHCASAERPVRLLHLPWLHVSVHALSADDAPLTAPKRPRGQRCAPQLALLAWPGVGLNDPGRQPPPQSLSAVLPVAVPKRPALHGEHCASAATPDAPP